MSRWSVILGGDYAVSDDGRVQRVTPGRRTWPGRMLKLTLKTCGYMKVSPVLNGKNVHCYVHDLVAEAFIGPKPEGKEVNHIDGVKTNNVWTNLEYVTHLGNMGHARRTGLSPVGSRCNRGHTTEEDVRMMRILRELGVRTGEIAVLFDVSAPCASEIVTRKKWRHVA